MPRTDLVGHPAEEEVEDLVLERAVLEDQASTESADRLDRIGLSIDAFKHLIESSRQTSPTAPLVMRAYLLKLLLVGQSGATPASFSRVMVRDNGVSRWVRADSLRSTSGSSPRA